MHGFKENIEKETTANSNFRKVLYTAKYSQIVLMSLLDIPLYSTPAFRCILPQ